MKNKFAHLADGTRVLVKHTPFPIAPDDMPPDVKVGTTLVGYSLAKFHPWRPAAPLIRRHYMALMGGDGKLWLVHQRQSELS